MPAKKRASTKRAREESSESSGDETVTTTTTTTTTTTATATRASTRATRSSSTVAVVNASQVASGVATEAMEEPTFADDISSLKPIKASLGTAHASKKNRTEIMLNPTEIKIDAGKVVAWQGTFKGVRIALDGPEGDFYCTATVSVMLPPRK